MTARDGRAALVDDLRVEAVQIDAKPEDAAPVLGDAAVSEVETEQVDVLRRQRPEVVRGGTARDAAGRWVAAVRRFAGEPAAKGRARDARRPRDREGRHARCVEIEDLIDGRPGMHYEHMFATTPDEKRYSRSPTRPW